MEKVIEKYRFYARCTQPLRARMKTTAETPTAAANTVDAVPVMVAHRKVKATTQRMEMIAMTARTLVDSFFMVFTS